MWGEESEGDIGPSSPMSGVSHWERSPSPSAAHSPRAGPQPQHLLQPGLTQPCWTQSAQTHFPGQRLAGTPMAHTLQWWKPGLPKKALERAPSPPGPG